MSTSTSTGDKQAHPAILEQQQPQFEFITAKEALIMEQQLDEHQQKQKQRPTPLSIPGLGALGVIGDGRPVTSERSAFSQPQQQQFQPEQQQFAVPQTFVLFPNQPGATIVQSGGPAKTVTTSMPYQSVYPPQVSGVPTGYVGQWAIPPTHQAVYQPSMSKVAPMQQFGPGGFTNQFQQPQQQFQQPQQQVQQAPQQVPMRASVQQPADSIAVAGEPTNSTLERWFQIGSSRFAVVKVWKGRVYVGIRQFNLEDNQWKVTRNGINLTEAEWKSLAMQGSQISAAVQECYR
ncbi:MAG: hypothetical protein GY696_11555 [Gammaproteobacteria bacterium]|nr:hypothetical protein [Gammaproteobacteria bacterium]